MTNFLSSFWEHYSWLVISIGYALLIFIIISVVGKVLKSAVIPFISKKIHGKGNSIPGILLRGFSKPLSIFFIILAGYSSLRFFFSSVPSTAPTFLISMASGAPNVLGKIMNIATIFCVSFGLIHSSSAYVLLLNTAREKLNLKITKSFVRFLNAIFTSVVVIIAFCMIISELGHDPSVLVTGLGLGGLTVALAAKDSAANFFGGLVLVIEHPFEIGDWISCADVEGTVEDINLRSTKIRTGPGSLMTVPNATLSNSDISNWTTGMEQRQANFKLYIEYGVLEKDIREYISSVKTMLETDPDIKTDSVIVNLTDLAENCIQISIIYYTVFPTYSKFLQVKERVNYSLLHLAEVNSIRFVNSNQMFTKGIRVISDKS